MSGMEHSHETSGTARLDQAGHTAIMDAMRSTPAHDVMSALADVEASQPIET